MSSTLGDFIETYSYLENDKTLTDVTEYVAGRVHSVRKAGSKLVFYDLRGDGYKLQVKISLGSYQNADNFKLDTEKIHRGDIIGIEGSPGRTKSGELSIVSKKVMKVIQ